MEKENKNRENATTYAMSAGLVLGGALIFIYFIQLQFCAKLPLCSLILSSLGFAITIFCVYHYTMVYNRDLLNGDITYFKALNFGMNLFFFVSMLLATFFYFYFQFINPKVLQQTIETSISLINHSNFNLTENDKILMVNNLKSMTAANFALSSMWSFFLMGFVLSIFTSFSFRNKNNIVN